MFRNWFKKSGSPGKPLASRSVQPCIEQLENRELLTGAISSSWFEQVAPPAIQSTTGVTKIQTLTHQGKLVKAVANEWVIQLTPNAAKQAGSPSGAGAQFASAPFRVQVVEGLGEVGQLLIRTNGATAANVRNWLNKQPMIVAQFEPNMVLKKADVPNDPAFDQQWALQNTGQTGGTPGADIHAPAAWDRTTGGSSVVVGVIDTGIDYTHPDLADNMWRNPGEIEANGIDDDRNGFVDDVFGYDFVNNDGNPMDDQGHGTHVAGTIAAVGNNGVGVTGVAWNASLMALKFLDASGSGYISNAVRALNYATMMKTQFGVNIHVTNNSWGGGGFSQQMADAITASGNADMLFIAAAGNNATNNDLSPHYPSSYANSNIIAVAATNNRDVLASFSNFGRTTVDVAAPGVSILSTLPGNRYGYLSGTSMAAPHVAGLAALAWSQAPEASSSTIRDAILDGVDRPASLTGKVATGGRINARRTLDLLPSTPSMSIDDVAVQEGTFFYLTSATFTVTLSAPATQIITVDYNTVDETATSPNDYQGLSGTVTFSPGDQTKNISITVLGDAAVEPDERFFVRLSNVHNATIADGSGTGTILNDDSATISISDVSIQEGMAGTVQAVFTVGLSAPAAQSVSVDFATANDSAVAPLDFDGKAGTLTFSPGETTKSITINVKGDAVLEANERFFVNLFNAKNATIADVTGFGTIMNDDRLAAGSSQLGVFRNGHDWFLDLNRDGYLAERVVGFGLPGDVPVTGDWNGDGRTDLGAVRVNTVRGGLDWYLDLNNDGLFAERVMQFGLLGDTPVVGDWNGDGRTDLGVARVNAVRGGLDWYLDLNNDGVFAERIMQFGLLGDTPIVGDWNGDGRADLGAVRANLARGGLDWYLDLNYDGLFAERTMQYGLLGDIPVVGDWNGDGRADLGAVRANLARGGLDWYLDLNDNGNLAELIVEYGLLGDTPNVNKW